MHVVTHLFTIWLLFILINIPCFLATWCICNISQFRYLIYDAFWYLSTLLHHASATLLLCYMLYLLNLANYDVWWCIIYNSLIAVSTRFSQFNIWCMNLGRIIRQIMSWECNNIQNFSKKILFKLAPIYCMSRK